MDTLSLTKYDWNNDIPFAANKVKRTLHALIGEEKPKILGLLAFNSENKKWGINPIYPASNELFGTYTFDQMNSSFSITVKEIDDNKCNMTINIGTPRDSYLKGNVAYLQDECNKFVSALTYYLQNQNFVDEWESEATKEKNDSQNNSGCLSSIIIVILVSFLSAFCLI